MQRLNPDRKLRCMGPSSVGSVSSGHGTFEGLVGAETSDVPVVGGLGRGLVDEAAGVVAVYLIVPDVDVSAGAVGVVLDDLGGRVGADHVRGPQRHVRAWLADPTLHALRLEHRGLHAPAVVARYVRVPPRPVRLVKHRLRRQSSGLHL